MPLGVFAVPIVPLGQGVLGPLFLGLAVVCAAAGVVHGAAPPQSSRPSFRSQVELVQVDVLATDAQGRLVRTLTKDDFEVLEDGKVRPVSAFVLVDVPVARQPAAAASSIPSDVQSNTERPLQRFYVLVLDDVQADLKDTLLIRKAASRFVEQYVQEGDMVAIVHTSGRRGTSIDFTSNPRRLLASISRFAGLELVATRPAVDTLNAMVDYLAGIKARRKALLYFGPGLPMARISAAPGMTAWGSTPPPIASRDPRTAPIAGDPEVARDRLAEAARLGGVGLIGFRELVTKANRANATFYPVDSRHLDGLAGLVTAERPGDGNAQEASVDKPLDVSPDNAGKAKAEFDATQDGHAWLATETGGFVFQNSNGLDATFGRIQRESSTYYVLGYTPAAPSHEGATHAITVRTSRTGVSLRARRTYTVPAASAKTTHTFPAKGVPPKLLPLLEFPVLSNGLSMSASAAVFPGAPGTAPSARITMQFDGHSLDLSGTGALDVAVVAVNETGGVTGQDVRRIDLAFGAAQRARVLDAGLRVQARVPIPAGTSALRIAAADPAGDRAGSMWIDVDVPDFDRAPLSMSGVVVTDGRAGDMATANVDKELHGVLAGPVSTRRAFAAGDTLTWMAESYTGAGAAVAVTTTSTITDAAGKVAFRAGLQSDGTDRGDGRIAVRTIGSTRLGGFAPGSYRLRVEATLASTGQSVSRDVAFRIVPTTALLFVPPSNQLVYDH